MNQDFLNELNQTKNKEDKKNQAVKDLLQACSNLEKQNKAILSTLNEFKLELGEKSIKMLQNVLKGVQTIDIPREVRLEKTQRVEFKDKTRKWLLCFFTCSLLVVVLSLGFAFYSYQYEYKPQKELEMSDKEKQWLIDYAEYMRDHNPKTHNKYLENNSISQ